MRITELNFDFVRSDVFILLAFFYSLLMLLCTFRFKEFYDEFLTTRLGFIAVLICYMIFTDVCLTCLKYHVIVVFFSVLILNHSKWGNHEKEI